jgi:cyanophycin synthetase
MKIISVTGTKGKTTVVRSLSNVIYRARGNTLRVDTDGYYINEKQKGDLALSKNLCGLVSSVCPGRFLMTMQKYYPNFTAILECSLGSSGSAGLGYRKHDIGIFTNVMEDHLGSSDRLKTKSDIARAKRFIFRRITLDGWAVFNADDEYVVSQLEAINPKHKITLIPIGMHANNFPLTQHLKDGGEWITYEHDWIILKSKSQSERLIYVPDVAWTFGGHYSPSIYNLMLIIGGLYANYDKKIPKKVLQLVTKTKLDRYGGRLTLLKSKNDVKIIIDFAHEKYSINEVGKLAKKLIRQEGKTIGVVRLALDRTDDLIKETGRYIANSFDSFVVYDKIDGILRKPTLIDPRKKFQHITGRVSSLLFEAIHVINKNSIRIAQEDLAIAEAARQAQPGDVVVVIANDDSKQTLKFVQKYFKASFV